MIRHSYAGLHSVRDSEPSIQQRTLAGKNISIARLSYTGNRAVRLEQTDRDDGYFFSIKLRALTSGHLWLSNRLVFNAAVRANALCSSHLQETPYSELQCPFDLVRFKVPRQWLMELLDDAGVRRVQELRCPTPGIVDDTVSHLTACLLPAFAQPEAACSLFVDSVSNAFGLHLLQAYGGAQLGRIEAKKGGGLAAWQERRVKELIDSRLDGSLTLQTLADECGISINHLGRAFKRSTGESPYQYLIKQRLSRAKSLMLQLDSSLADVALACGFATQSHFNNHFVKATGMPPGVWRRLNRSEWTSQAE